MICPMCGQDAEPDEQPLADGVTVFCCERCATGVLRTFAFHGADAEDRQGRDGAERGAERAAG